MEALTEQNLIKEELERAKSQMEGLEQVGVLFSMFLPTPPSDNPMYEVLTSVLAQRKTSTMQLVRYKYCSQIHGHVDVA